MSQQKIFLQPRELVPKLEELRAQRKRIVFGNGCFELLHVGHVRYLYGAKACGDVLIVGVNTDGSMRKIKPDRDPINPDHERFELIAALEMVDFVVPLAEENPIPLLEILRPDVHTKGTDYQLEDIPERLVVESYGGEVRLVGDPKEHSTTEMLRVLRGRGG